MRRWSAAWLAALALGLGLAGCGSGKSPIALLGTTTSTGRPGGTTVTTGVGVTTTAAGGPTSTAPATATTATAAATTTRPAPATTSGPVYTGLPGVLQRLGSSSQAVVVTADAGSSTGTLTAYAKSAGGWQAVFGPWVARVGTNGFAPQGEKREGDGRTPAGIYGFGFFFGVSPDPGVRFPYRVVSQSTVWVDDPASSRYNLWADSGDSGIGANPESMYQPVAYKYGAVIAYNTDRTPGLGSAIFLHASTGGPTAGCVSLAVDQLVQVLQWLDPALTPQIALNVSS